MNGHFYLPKGFSSNFVQWPMGASGLEYDCLNAFCKAFISNHCGSIGNDKYVCAYIKVPGATDVLLMEIGEKFSSGFKAFNPVTGLNCHHFASSEYLAICADWSSKEVFFDFLCEFISSKALNEMTWKTLSREHFSDNLELMDIHAQTRTSLWNRISQLISAKAPNRHWKFNGFTVTQRRRRPTGYKWVMRFSKPEVLERFENHWKHNPDEIHGRMDLLTYSNATEDDGEGDTKIGCVLEMHCEHASKENVRLFCDFLRDAIGCCYGATMHDFVVTGAQSASTEVDKQVDLIIP